MFWMPDQVRHDEFGLFTNSSDFEGIMSTPLEKTLIGLVVKNASEIPDEVAMVLS
jgi:hypothetical protein